MDFLKLVSLSLNWQLLCDYVCTLYRHLNLGIGIGIGILHIFQAVNGQAEVALPYLLGLCIDQQAAATFMF